MTVKEIVSDWLKANGYDGLYDDTGLECCCFLADLMCDNDCISSCKPGYRIIMPDDSEFPGEEGMGPNKETTE